MIDRILLTSSTEAVIIYTHRSPVHLHASDGNIESLLHWFFSPCNSTSSRANNGKPLDLQAYRARLRAESQGTCDIILPRVS